MSVARLSDALAAGKSKRWLARFRAASPLGGSAPRTVKEGRCQQVVKLGTDVHLREWPILRHWPADAAPAITGGTIFTRCPETGQRGVDSFDLQVLDKNRLGVCWTSETTAARHFQIARERNKPLPMAIAIGGDPLYALMVMAPLPHGVDPCELGGFLRGKPLDLVRCRSIDLETPADAELVIEGEIAPDEPLVEIGPLAGTTGFYQPARQGPVLTVSALTQRVNPLYVAAIPGPPPHERTVMLQALHRLVLPLYQQQIPELVAWSLPGYGAGRHQAFVSIKKTHARQARQAADALWSMAPTMFSKLLILVDEDVDVHHPEQVLQRVAAEADMAADVFFSDGPGDTLDGAARNPLHSRRMAIDATTKLPEEHQGTGLERLRMSQDVQDEIERRMAEADAEGV